MSWISATVAAGMIFGTCAVVALPTAFCAAAGGLSAAGVIAALDEGAAPSPAG